MEPRRAFLELEFEIQLWLGTELEVGDASLHPGPSSMEVLR